jgi:hypothetical protein
MNYHNAPQSTTIVFYGQKVKSGKGVVNIMRTKKKGLAASS